MTPYARAAIEAEAATVAAAAEGTRNHALNRAAFKLGRLVAGGECTAQEAGQVLADACVENGLAREDGPRACEATIRSGLASGMASPRSAPERPARAAPRAVEDETAAGDCVPPWDAPPPDDDCAPGEIVDDPGEAWRDLLPHRVNSKTGEVVVYKNAAAAMIYGLYHPDLRGRLALDARAQRPVWALAPPWDADGEPRSLAESDGVEGSAWLSRAEGVTVGDGYIFKGFVAAAARRPFDIVRQWMDRLAWDGTPRLDDWLERYAGAPPSPYVAEVGRRWLISAVARTYQPGCQADHMLVLEGSQGERKTSLLRALAGPPGWHAEVAVGAARDELMALHGPLICEWSELTGVAKRDTETVKSVITRVVDRLRLPYGRLVVDLPRRCVIAATTNEERWATDPSGNRRYWPVRCGHCDPDGIALAREQLWAEAVVAYRAREPWWLTGEIENIACAQQEDRVQEDPWDAQVEVVLAKLGHRASLSTDDVLEEMTIPAVQRTSAAARRIAPALRAAGWTLTRPRDETGRRLRVWVHEGSDRGPHGVPESREACGPQVVVPFRAR